jgi:hypothetical protein
MQPLAYSVSSTVIVQTVPWQVGRRHDSGWHGLPPTICAASSADSVRTVSRLKESLLAFVSLFLFAFLFIYLSLLMIQSSSPTGTEPSSARRTPSLRIHAGRKAAYSVDAHADKTRTPKGFPNKSTAPAT